MTCKDMLILFDFDDTLVCSTFLTQLFNKQSGNNYADVKNELLLSIEAKATNLLASAMGKGRTKIVSNAEHAWITYVLDNFFPALRLYIKANQIEIISARQLYQDVHQDSFKWKEDCFRQEIKQHLLTVKDKNNFMLISIGDGLFERIACKIVAAEFNIPYCSLKLLDAPSPQLLCHQLDVITRCFAELIANPLNQSTTAQSKQTVEYNSVQYLSNDLFFDFNRDRTGICIYHWEKRLETDDPSDDTEDLGSPLADGASPTPRSSASEGVKEQGSCIDNIVMDKQLVQSEEEKCHMLRAACLGMAGQVAASFGVVTSALH